MSYKQEWNRDYSPPLSSGNGGFLIHKEAKRMFKQIREDIECVKKRDPAARSAVEILLLYPGLKAIRAHRLAYKLYHKNYISLQDMFHSVQQGKRELKSILLQKSAKDFS